MIYKTDKDRKPLRPMTDREVVQATVHELRNALTPAISLAQANGKPEVVLELLTRGVERSAEWLEKVVDHLREVEELETLAPYPPHKVVYPLPPDYSAWVSMGNSGIGLNGQRVADNVLESWIHYANSLKTPRPQEELEVRFGRMEKLGLVKLAVLHDDQATFEQYEGDMYNAEANPDIPAEKLAAERVADKAKFEDEGGAWGLACYISVSGGWQYVDGVWGMYPRDYAEDKDNEYRPQLMQAALAKFDELMARAG